MAASTGYIPWGWKNDFFSGAQNMIYIFSSKSSNAVKRALAPLIEKSLAALVPGIPKDFKAAAEDLVYLDISSLPPPLMKKNVAQLKKCAAFWGIIDPAGIAEDPASFFFDGACDYIGPALVKKGLDKKRFTTVLKRAAEKGGPAAGERSPGVGKKEKSPGDAETEERKKSQKLPIGKFGGWKTIRPGTTESFFFLFVTLSDREKLRSLVSESALDAIKNRLRDALGQAFREADALLWMETEDNYLFLVPSRAANCKAAVEAALKLILNSRLIGIEKLGLSMPMEFTCALHHGKTTFQAPGKTGSVVSEPVNYIFHLGIKKAEAGRLTVSGDVGEEAIPEGLADMFQNAGNFEGIAIRHSRHFINK